MRLFSNFVITLSLLMLGNGHLNAAERGTIIGGVTHQAPSWFRESFLDIADDVDEAAEENKHVILFFQLNDCPYCDRMLSESFESEPLTSYIQQHFDTIAINVRGDREIAFNEDISVTEKELSKILEVFATPAIVFLNNENETIARVNGYRAPQRFQTVLEYVATGAYESLTLGDFQSAKLARNVYQLRDNTLFSNITDLSSVDGPLMVIFEDGSCYDCNEFHDGVLAHEDVLREISAFTIVRLDTDSDQVITDLSGNKTTAGDLARQYNMLYRPGVLAFDDGNLIRRTDSLVFPHHFKELMRFVAGGFHKELDYATYSQQRTEELLSSGVTIDLGRPVTK